VSIASDNCSIEQLSLAMPEPVNIARTHNDCTVNTEEITLADILENMRLCINYIISQRKKRFRRRKSTTK
jgi:hypothetical protein